MKKYFTLLIVAFPFILLSQNAVLSSGGNASGTSGSSSFSVGQVVYSFKSSSSGTETQGVQQSFTISSVSTNNINGVSISVYPNPTSNDLIIDFGTKSYANHKYVITDLIGKAIVQDNILQRNTKVDLNSFASATYFINVYDQNNQITNSFKVIKH